MTAAVGTAVIAEPDLAAGASSGRAHAAPTRSRSG